MFLWAETPCGLPPEFVAPGRLRGRGWVSASLGTWLSKCELCQDVPGRSCLLFVLNTLCALAGPAPDTEPNIERKANNPKGIPCPQWFPTCIPFIFKWDRRALAVCRDGQESDDRDNLFSIRIRTRHAADAAGSIGRRVF